MTTSEIARLSDALMSPFEVGTIALVTLSNGWESALTKLSETKVSVEYTEVLEHALQVLADGGAEAIVLRVLEDEPYGHIQYGGRKVLVNYKTVYGWAIANHKLSPLDSSSLYGAYFMDPRTGQPTPPEPWLHFGDAWEISA